MGIIFSRWRKKKTTSEILEEIEGEITNINTFKRDTQAFHKKLIGYMVGYFALLYFLACLVIYFKYLNHPDWQDVVSQIQLFIPLIIAPFIFLLIKRILTWWYHRKIKKNEVQLEDLKKKKGKILDEVMEIETYKVAKEILEKYAPEQLRNQSVFSSSKVSTSRMPSLGSSTPSLGAAKTKSVLPLTPATSRSNTSIMPASSSTSATSELRRRATAGSSTPSAALSTPASRAPIGANPSTLALRSAANSGANDSVVGGARRRSGGMLTSSPNLNNTGALSTTLTSNRGSSGPPLPRPVLPRERGYMDRMVEYLVGDGPANRFALICKQCQSHNGMALKEEFEYIAFRCCYCFYWNPARKQRPTAPKLATGVQRQSSTESTSEDEESLPKQQPKQIKGPSGPSSKPTEAKKVEKTEAKEDDKSEDKTEDVTTEKASKSSDESEHEEKKE